MALGNYGIKRPRLVSFVRGSKNRREREGRAKEEKRMRRREEEEEKIKRYGCLDFGMELLGLLMF